LLLGGGKRKRIVEPTGLDIGQRNRGEQLPRMLRCAENTGDGSVFDDLALVQDRPNGMR
jgi:hypothetical protein